MVKVKIITKQPVILSYDKKLSVRIYILCHNEQRFNQAKLTYSKYYWAVPIQMKYQDCTFENAFWKQLLEIKEEWIGCEMVGTLSSIANTKLNLSKIDQAIHNKDLWNNEYYNFMNPDTPLFNCHPHLLEIIHDVCSIMGVRVPTEAFCNYWMCTPTLMTEFIHWFEEELRPTVLMHPLIMTNSTYAGKLTPSELMLLCGTPYYPHTPFVFERMNKVFFMNKQPIKTILFTNARNENNIKEWAVHHLGIGFTHIHIVDHKSIKNISDQFLNFPEISVSRIDGDITKGLLIRDAHRYARTNGYDWMLYLDADEFLVLNNHANICDFLEIYRTYDQVGINWLLFGSNNLTVAPSGTILESYTRSEEMLNPHIKSFLNLRSANTVDINEYSPHVYKLKKMDNSVAVDNQQLDQDAPYWYYNNIKYTQASAYIAHYIYQSYETYIARKIYFPRDDTNTFREILSEEEMHSQCNNVVNTSVRDKYNDINKENIRYNGKFEIEQNEIV
jgi:hypothetical protein